MYKINQTTRKFYNKWLYKITVRAPGAAVFRLTSIEHIPQFLDDVSSEGKLHRLHYFSKALSNRIIIEQIISNLLLLDKKEYFTRVERDTVDIYVNEQQHFDCLREKLKDNIIQVSKPDQNSIDLLDRKVIIVKKYPKDGFHYRVYLKPHTVKDREDKLKYLDWLSQNPDYNISNRVKSWFLITDWNWDRRYMLVKNEPALLMMKLRNPEVVGSVYEYVISDK